MNHYKLKISYAGQNYFGWQIQKETELTIQGQLEKAFRLATGIKKFKTIGSGRTDAGVHALGQTVLIELSEILPEAAFLKGVNQQLPLDIKILSVEKVDSRFHPIFSAKEKTYQYMISKKPLSPFLRNYFLEYQKLMNIELLQKGASLFVGEHNFINYFCVGTEVNSTVREMFSVDVVEKRDFTFAGDQVSGDFVCLEFRGTGFLKQQVRLMVGVLLALNEGRVNLEDIQHSLSGPKNKHLAPVVPSMGLYLVDVVY